MQALYFIRHGESEDNLCGLWSSTHSPLTEKGEQQARSAGEAAKAAGLHFDLLLISPLPRAQQTARIFAQSWGVPDITAKTLDFLAERDWGSLTGTPSVGSDGQPFDRKLIDEAPGAEKLHDLQARAASALEVIRQHPQQNILIVGHGSFGRAMRRAIEGSPPTDEYNPEALARLYIQNAQVVRLI